MANTTRVDDDRGALYSGFGEALSRAFEMALTPAIFGGLGYLVDRALGTSPVVAVALFLFAVLGSFARMWYGYDARMKAIESSGPWSERQPSEPRP